MKKWIDIISLIFKVGDEFAKLWELGKLKRIGALGYEIKKKSDMLMNMRPIKCESIRHLRR